VVESPVRERLVHEYPFAGDDAGAMRLGNKFLGPIAHHGSVLFLHKRTPIWIGKQGTNRGQDWRQQRRGGHGGEDEGLLRYPEASLGMCGHPVMIDQGSDGHRRDRSVHGCHRSQMCRCHQSRRLTWTTNVGDR
jgi:hypothetical protein